MKYSSGTILLVFLTLILEGQSFSNLNFEQTCVESNIGICHWERSWGKKEAIKLDSFTKKNRSLLFDNKVAGVSFVEQDVEISEWGELKIIELSGKIKTNGISGKGAGLNIGIYDSTGTLVFSKDMGYSSSNWATNTKDWTRYSITAVCPVETVRIKIGVILYGKGQAWFDDLEVHIVSVKDRQPSLLAKTYISAAVDTIAKHSLRKDSVDIHSLKQVAFQIAGSAKSYQNCHLAVTYLLQSLGDHHSFFMEPEAVKDWSNHAPETEVPFPEYRNTDSCGYLWIPHFHLGDSLLIQAFADSIQRAIQFLETQQIKGWVVDLRDNTGGNMEPMILGLGPLFDEEHLGGLVNVYGVKEIWGYKKGRYLWNEKTENQLAKSVILKSKLPIAVLIGPNTGSSGEAVTISFIGNGMTKIFGTPTWGLTTGNGDFDLIDGARMMLASTRMADRNGNIYFGKISPDIFVPKHGKGNPDAALLTAIKWIKQKKENDTER